MGASNSVRRTATHPPVVQNAPQKPTPRHIPTRAPARIEPTFPTPPPKNVPKVPECPNFIDAFRAGANRTHRRRASQPAKAPPNHAAAPHPHHQSKTAKRSHLPKWQAFPKEKIPPEFLSRPRREVVKQNNAARGPKTAPVSISSPGACHVQPANPP